MNRKSRLFALSLSMSMMVSLCPNVSAQNRAEINIEVEQAPSGSPPTCEQVNPTFNEQRQGQLPASEVIELYYIRSSKVVVKILEEIVKVNPCLGGIIVTRQGNNTIVLYGQEAQRDFLKRVIAVLDLRREGVDMAMWGILISSENPGELAQAMREINREITRTRELLLETYIALQEEAREIPIDRRVEELLDKLGYRGALDRNRLYLSMTDILLRISAAKNPEESYKTIAQSVCEIFEDERYLYYTDELRKSGRRPFSNYLNVVFPELDNDYGDQCGEYTYEPEAKIRYLIRSFRRRRATLEFALNYADVNQRPNEFKSEALQKSAENLNLILGLVVDAINRDIEELFMEPTLKRIQEIVGHFGDVSYAEVGRTNVIGLNGIQSSVASTTVSSFDETGPLRLNELLREAGELNQFSQDLFPSIFDEEVPASSIVSLVAALSADRSIFRALTSGVSLDITPSVLRNSTSAELDISLTTAPQATETTTEDANLRPLSRISQNTVDTTVYVNTLDIFPISTFNNQTTIDGGRTYIPVIGTIWQGIFSGIPIFGDLFSWRNHPRSVQHQSIVLTNSFIVPTAMGLAPLYETGRKTDLFSACNSLYSYFSEQQRRLDELKEEQERTFLNPDSSEEQVFGQPPSSGFPPPSFGSSTSFGYSRECERFRTNPL
ncbi:MAG: hypothetical protein AB4057_09750 [Crocosphaera sp.]